MTIIQIAKTLIENQGAFPKARDYVDRLMLRIVGSPALLAYLDNVTITDDGNVEVIFQLVPDDILPDIQDILATDDVKVYKFTSSFHPKVGFRLSGFKETEA